MSGHLGLDVTGWNDRAVRITPDGPEAFRVVSGPASVVTPPGSDMLVGGDAATIAGAGRVAGCGARHPLLQHPLGTERGSAVWPVHLRWLAGDARQAVLAIPDSPDWDEARRQALIDAAQRARLDPTLLWRSVATLLGLPGGVLPRGTEPADVVVVSLTAEATTISRLGLETDPASGLLTPLRRRFGTPVPGREAAGLQLARQVAADLSRRLDMADDDRLLWSTPTVADMLAGRRPSPLDIQLADGRWLVEPPEPTVVAPLGARLVAAVRSALAATERTACAAVVVEGPFAISPAPGGTVGQLICDAAARLFPGATCLVAPAEAVAAGAAEHARRLALGLPTYFDFLPQIEIAAHEDDEPVFVPLIPGQGRIAGGTTYKAWVEQASFAVTAGTRDLPFFLAMQDEDKVRRLVTTLSPPPTGEVAIKLHVEQRPAQGHARVEIVPRDAAARQALGRSMIALDWGRLELTDLDRDGALEQMQRGYSWPTELPRLPAHVALWEQPVPVGTRSVLPHDLLEELLRVPNGQVGSARHSELVKATRAFFTRKIDPSRIPNGRWKEHGKHGAVDSDGMPPARLPAASGRLLDELRSSLAQLIEKPDLKPVFRAQLGLLGSWLYTGAPAQVREYLGHRIREGNLARNHVEGPGRCLGTEPELRLFYRLLNLWRTEGKLGQSAIKAAAQSLQWRERAAYALDPTTAFGLTQAALDAMKEHRRQRTFRIKYQWSQQLLFILLRYRLVDRSYLSPRAERWASLRSRVDQEVDQCRKSVEAANRRDLAELLREYTQLLDSRAKDGGLIVRGDPDKSSEEDDAEAAD